MSAYMHRLRRWLPDPDTVRSNRWLRWLGPALHHPRLWHMNRRGLALGMALGFFFGLLVPLAQIPQSAAAAVLLRANVPAAVASTLVTNPLTFGPIYYAAWQVGHAILGTPESNPPAPAPAAAPAVQASPAVQAAPAADAAPDALDAAADDGWWRGAVRRVLGVGKPLMLGLAILATAFGLATYFVVSAVWKVSVLWKRHRRRR
jgi:uncharacterized protein (DUF2062 family)